MSEMVETMRLATMFGNTLVPGAFIIGLLCLIVYYAPKHDQWPDWGIREVDLSTDKAPDNKVILVDVNKRPASMTNEQYIDFVMKSYPKHKIGREWKGGIS